MDTRRVASLFLVSVVASLVAGRNLPAQEDLAHRIHRMSDAEQVAATKLLLERGVPDADSGDDLAILVLWGKSALILPMLELKIEAILKAPQDAFTDKTIDPHRVVMQLCSSLAYAGNQQALREAGRLLKLDERRFDGIVQRVMISAQSSGRGFTVAYQGFDIGDAAIDKRLVAWAEPLLVEELPKVGSPLHENVRGIRREWAEALAERYGAAPTSEQWMNDPLVSRLKPELAGKLYHDVHRFAVEAASKLRRK